MNHFLRFLYILGWFATPGVKGSVTEGESGILFANSNKTFYLGTISSSFYQAMADCEDRFGGSLANIDTKNDLDLIIGTLGNYSIAGVWIGLVPIDQVDLIVECFPPGSAILFDKNCWTWSTSEKYANLFEELEWSSTTLGSYQLIQDRGVLDIKSGTFSLANEYLLKRYICERSRTAHDPDTSAKYAK